jgi:HEAT repeat protein
MYRFAKSTSLLAVVFLATTVGCQSLSWPTFWPFPERELTTYRAPAMRIDAIKAFAAQSTGVDSPEQRQITDQLARQIQIETDPLVRTAIVQTIAEFRTPIAQQVIEAGLADDSAAVRIACCRAIGERASAASVGTLAQALRSDKDVDVRLAAAQALGHIKTPESMQAVAVALDDRDPAMQFVGVQSMKSITGKDYGGDVAAWRQVAAGQTPPPPQAPSLAERVRSVSPF